MLMSSAQIALTATPSAPWLCWTQPLHFRPTPTDKFCNLSCNLPKCSFISKFPLSKSISNEHSDAEKSQLALINSPPPDAICANTSFSLDKNSGKKCYMLSARDLSIVWSDTPRYWKWISPPGSRFAELAELIRVCWLEIRGKINTSILSPFTLYTAYLVFKLSTTVYGFQDRPVDVAVGLVGTESNTKSVKINSRLHVSRSSKRCKDQFPIDREDGWMEIELGEFFNKKDDEELEMSVQEVKSGSWKGGLLVQGIEIRPKLANK